jgi:hypothetical protein
MKTIDTKGVGITQVIVNEAWRYRVWGLTFLVGVFYLSALCPQFVPESSKYIVEAKLLAEGERFSSTLFPPGFPLMLAPLYYIFSSFPGNLLALQAVPFLFGLLSIPVIYAFLERYTDLDRGMVAFIVLLIAVAPLILLHSTQWVLTETPYIFFSILAILLLEKSAGTERRSTLYLCLAVLAMAASYYIRVVGLVLPVVGIVYLLLRKDWRRALLVLVLFVLLLAPWMYRNYSLGLSPLTSDYGDSFKQKVFERPELGTIGPGDLVLRVLSNAWVHATNTILWLLLPAAIDGAAAAWLGRVSLGYPAWVPAGIGVLLSTIILVGFFSRLRQELRSFDLYVVFYTGSILLPPWYAERNLLPILPFLLYYLVLGIQWLADRLAIARRWPVAEPRLLSMVALSVLLAGFLASDRHALATATAYRSGEIRETDETFLELCQWVKDNTGEDDLFMYSRYNELYLYTDRRAVNVPEIPGREEFRAELYRLGVDYVVLEPFRGGYAWGRQDQNYLQPTIMQYPESFEPTFEIDSSPRVIVYRVK